MLGHGMRINGHRATYDLGFAKHPRKCGQWIEMYHIHAPQRCEAHRNKLRGRNGDLVWYSSSGATPIPSPARTSVTDAGAVYVHQIAPRNLPVVLQVWLWAAVQGPSFGWIAVDDPSEHQHPHQHNFRQFQAKFYPAW